MIDDDILREIRKTREQFAAEHNYDLHAMFRALKAVEAAEAASGRPVVRRSPRPPVKHRPVVAPPTPAVERPIQTSNAAG